MLVDGVTLVVGTNSAHDLMSVDGRIGFWRLCGVDVKLAVGCYQALLWDWF